MRFNFFVLIFLCSSFQLYVQQSEPSITTGHWSCCCGCYCSCHRAGRCGCCSQADSQQNFPVSGPSRTRKKRTAAISVSCLLKLYVIYLSCVLICVGWRKIFSDFGIARTSLHNGIYLWYLVIPLHSLCAIVLLIKNVYFEREPKTEPSSLLFMSFHARR